MAESFERWKQEIAKGPFSKNGFSKPLQRRILSQLDQKPARKPWRMAWLAGVSACMILLLVIFGGNWMMKKDWSLSEMAITNKQAGSSVPMKQEEPINNVLLLGLRSQSI